jgi:hypothetical protein
MIFSKYDMFDRYKADLDRYEQEWHEDDCPACGNDSLDDDGVCALSDCGVDAIEFAADQRSERC